jgi:hypothetical protein
LDAPTVRTYDGLTVEDTALVACARLALSVLLLAAAVI